jgi:predicted RecB family nuclease
LKALAIREKKIHIVGSPEMKIEGTPVYMDVEGLPDRDFYYLIGVRFKTGDSVVHHSLWADSPSDEGSIWREFLSKLMEVENPVQSARHSKTKRGVILRTPDEMPQGHLKVRIHHLHSPMS